MPKRAHRKLKGMPRAKKGDKFLVIKGSKGWIVNKLKKRRKKK